MGRPYGAITPSLMPSVKAAQATGLKVSIGPLGSFESRTSMATLRSRTSVHCPLDDDLLDSAKLREWG